MTNRDSRIDVARGVAIVGIVPENIITAGIPVAFFSDMSRFDSLVWAVSTSFFSGPFRFIFYLLFGLSLGMVYLSSTTIDISKYLKRSLVLIGFGVINTYLLIFSQDILITLGIVSLMVLPLLSLKPVNLLAVSGIIALSAFMFYHTVIVTPTTTTAVSTEIADINTILALEQTWHRHAIEVTDAKQTGYPQALAWAVDNTDRDLKSFFLFEIWECFIVVLLGVFISAFRAHFSLVRRTPVPGIILTGIGAWWGAHYSMSIVESNFAYAMVSILPFRWEFALRNLILASGYLWLIFYLWEHTNARWLQWLRSISRYSLSLYLMQSLLYLAIFILLGRFNHYTISELYVMTLAICVVTVLTGYSLHRAGLRGPAECVSKSLYGS